MTNGDKRFLPFNKIKGQEVIVVDGLHPTALTLSHWKGANKLEEIAADSSGEIVLNAILKNYQGLEAPYVSATHFDIDGFVGVFALFYPSLALKYEETLREMAIIGDFREYEPKRKDSDLALKLCCWMNKVEKERFYRPFEEKDEIEECVPKFEYFLKVFPEVLENIDQYESDWKEEFSTILSNLEMINNREAFPNIGLISVEACQPLHYYALFSQTNGFDIVLSLYPENKYELEYKYTSWIDLASRPAFPRIDLKPLADQLNSKEESGYVWKVDRITDTGPILRLEDAELSKAERYANPTERRIYSSSIDPTSFKEMVVRFFERGYKNIKPKKFWTWNEMRALKHEV